MALTHVHITAGQACIQCHGPVQQRLLHFSRVHDTGTSWVADWSCLRAKLQTAAKGQAGCADALMSAQLSRLQHLLRSGAGFTDKCAIMLADTIVGNDTTKTYASLSPQTPMAWSMADSSMFMW